MADSARQSLVEGILEGDRDAVEALDRWTEVVLWQYARSLQDEWGDLKQEVRTRTFQNLKRGTFNGTSALHTYVHRIAKNVCIDALRARQKRLERSVSLRHQSSSLVSSSRADAIPITRDLVGKVLAEVSAEDRRLLELVFVDHLSYGEIARHLAVPEGTVKSRMSRCKARLVERRRALLAREVHES